MLVVNLVSHSDEEFIYVILQDFITDKEKEIAEDVCEYDRESDRRARDTVARIQSCFDGEMLYRSTELVEKMLGYFWDRFESEGSDNPDIEYLMDDIGCTEEEMREVFNHLGYGKE